MGPVAPTHLGSSQTRARTRVPCIGRQIHNHCTTREAPYSILKTIFKNLSPSEKNPKPSSKCHQMHILYGLFLQRDLFLRDKHQSSKSESTSQQIWPLTVPSHLPFRKQQVFHTPIHFLINTDPSSGNLRKNSYSTGP